MGKLGLGVTYMVKGKYGLIALAIGCFAMTSFVNHQNVQAAETVIKNKARLDKDYPLSASSDFMMVAGNQFIHTGEQFNGRIMANSVLFTTGDSNNKPGINGSMETTVPDARNKYFEALENPAIIINDMQKSAQDPNNLKNIIYHLSEMWQGKDKEGKVTKQMEFATDTPLSVLTDKYPELNPESPAEPHKNVALFNGGKGNLSTLYARMVPGIDGKLSQLPQYLANGVNRYETPKQSEDGAYSLQQNIQDVSDAFASLTPFTGENARSFWTNSDQIMNKEENDGKGNIENPIYMTDENSQLSDIVVNITAKADEDESAPKYDPKPNGLKPIVAITLDRDKLTTRNPNAKHMDFVFNFSDSFYTTNAVGKRLLDPEKIPYIVINYHNFGTHRFNFGSGDGFYIGDINHRQVTESQFGTGKFVRSIAIEVGASGINEWSNPAVLKMGSLFLNNFTDTYDSTVEDGDDITQDAKGTTGDTAAVAYTNRTDGTLLFGTMLVPRGSYYAGSESAGLYVGGVVAANNITLNRAIISPDHDKAVFGTGNDFGGIEPTKPDITIDSIDLNDPGSKNSQSLKSGGTAKFDYADGALKPAPSLGITGELKLSNVPDSYGLYYRYNRNGNNDKGDWRRYSDGAQTGTSVKLDQESLLADLNNQTKATAGIMKTEAQKISYPLTKTSGIEFATTADAKAATIAADKIETTATFKFTLQVDASLEVTVPAKISFGTDILGNSSGEATRTVAINEIQLTQKTVADTGTPEEPRVVVYNPLLSGFNLKLAYLDANATSQNPFFITNNFKYNINTAAPVPLAPDKSDGEWIDGILKRDTTPQSLETKMSNNPLKSSSLQLHLPYRNDYKVSSNAYTAPMGWQLTL